MWPELRDKRRGTLQTSLKMDSAELIEVQLLQLETTGSTITAGNSHRKAYCIVYHALFSSGAC